MDAPGLNLQTAKDAADFALEEARKECPKLSGFGAKNILPLSGEGFFGLSFINYIWIQNSGARPQTMRWLAGRVIPMWIDDPTGAEQRKNPKAKVRRTESGRTQILIFRKAAKIGATKLVKKKVGGIIIDKRTAMSYPGAPGRISVREAAAPYTTPGRIGGRIASGNVGVRWYFPGLSPRGFLNHAIEDAASFYQIQGTIKMGYNFISPDNNLVSVSDQNQNLGDR